MQTDFGISFILSETYIILATIQRTLLSPRNITRTTLYCISNVDGCMLGTEAKRINIFANTLALKLLQLRSVGTYSTRRQHEMKTNDILDTEYIAS